MDLKKLPDPILFIGTEAVAMPYDYEDKDLSAGPNMPVTTATKCLSVKASISSKTLGKSPSMSFRVPFCGFNYQASQPMSFSDPTAVRMGTNSQTTFRIFYPQGTTPGSSTTPSSSLSIDLDQTYSEANKTLERINETECRLTVLTDVLSRHQNMVVRVGSAKPYLMPIPPEDKPSPKASQPVSFSEPTVVRTGTNLYTVFRIFYPQGFGGTTTTSSSLSIDLDQTYSESNTATLVRMSDTEYRFTRTPKQSAFCWPLGEQR